jgi:hypothetical protein
LPSQKGQRETSFFAGFALMFMELLIEVINESIQILN